MSEKNKARIQITLPLTILKRIVEINERFGFEKQKNYADDLKIFINLALPMMEKESINLSLSRKIKK
jgi:hypothetical protein